MSDINQSRNDMLTAFERLAHLIDRISRQQTAKIDSPSIPPIDEAEKEYVASLETLLKETHDELRHHIETLDQILEAPEDNL